MADDTLNAGGEIDAELVRSITAPAVRGSYPPERAARAALAGPAALAVLLENTGDQAHGGRLAIGSGDGNEWNARIVAVGKHAADDRFADRPSLAVGGLQVHA